MIDYLMKKYGYSKEKEDKFGVRYVKTEKQNFEHIVAVLHKASGKHILQSYDAEVLEGYNEYFNPACGVEIPVLLLMWLKAKKLAFKYRWERRNDATD